MIRFEDKLVLGKWIFHQFGMENLEVLGKTLSADHLIGFTEEYSTKFLFELCNLLPEENRVVNNELLRQYDDNVVKHWRQITDKRNRQGNILYPLYFQYLSLLFTEHYLNIYFENKSELCKHLNQFLVEYNHTTLPEKHRIEPFKESELNKLAIWVATGGGKTLIMHVNILQFHHYRNKYGKNKNFNRTIILTTNESLSLQHQDEMHASDMEAQLFVKDGGGLFADLTTQIIDIHKLKDKSGDKTVAVESFESNNLVLVDEGHRGASGIDWIGKRNQLCEDGFSFEYSATFGQAIKAASGKDTAPAGKQSKSAKYRLIQQYAKSILFDYSYKFFHGDGYGKDHLILNLSDAWTEEQTQLYLTGCILSFYQQKLLYKNKHVSIKDYLLADPLWIFVGGKVTAQNEANADTVSDIQAIMRFVSRFVANGNGESVHFIDLFLKQQDDLRDTHGKLIFSGHFDYLHRTRRSMDAQITFFDVLKIVFNAETSGILHVVHLKGSDGEIALRIGENDFFGVINIGDAAKLISQCEEAENNGKLFNTTITTQNFSRSLFKEINKENSSINLLVGAKKFTEGWSSWRVSTMGLMNVGRSEGSEIIQLFGRGVRLKGYKFCLKRSSYVEGIRHPDDIHILETLNVFGIRSDYMKEFEEYLEEEGVNENNTKIISLPVIKRLSRNDLNLIRVKTDITPFKRAKKPFLEKQPKEMYGRVTLNWYPKIQSKRSILQYTSTLDFDLNEGFLEQKHLAFLDYDEIYFELAQYKNEKAWYNLQLDRGQIKELLQDPSWYRLLIPADMLEVTNFERVEIWQEIATSLLKKYAERYYHFKKQEYESPHIEYYQLSENDGNFINEYKATIDHNEQLWIEKITELKERLSSGTFHDNWSFGNLKAFDFSRHLYQPLIHFKNNEIVKLNPVALNDGEYLFVEDLKCFYSKNTSFFDNKDIYLLRNQSKGSGSGFFEAGNFYPDFVLWLINDHLQHVCFIDPKGLGRIHGFDDPKIKFSKTIKEIEKRLGDPNIILDSFIISNTFEREISWWKNSNNKEKSFEENHILFQKEEKENYIGKIFNLILRN
ncbi:TPA: DEAD/DEAH box helicase family protein [Legionella pneumophila]|nr:hypothetical protein [Legionella pneumophila]